MSAFVNALAEFFVNMSPHEVDARLRKLPACMFESCPACEDEPCRTARHGGGKIRKPHQIREKAWQRGLRMRARLDAAETAWFGAKP